MAADILVDSKNEISFEAKIVMVADTIDSATTDRPHKKGKSIIAIFDEIKDSPDKYDLEIIKKVSEVVNVPVIACGGAGCLNDFSEAVNIGGAAAVAVGSLFVFHGKNKAVLVSYPKREELEGIFK